MHQWRFHSKGAPDVDGKPQTDIGRALIEEEKFDQEDQRLKEIEELEF
jgi:hypothetical protein